MTRTPIRIAAALLLTLAACSGDDGGTGPTPPSQTTGSISGSVMNGTAGVANATVALSGAGTTTTSAAGQFSFNNVAAGSHTLTLTIPTGMQLATGEVAARSVTVAAGQTANVTWNVRNVQPPASTVDTVRLVGTAFQPANLTIQRGRTVVWVNTQPIFHNIVPEGHSQWTTANTSTPGEALRVTFNNAGSFAYVCTPHRAQGMTGTITVQ